jgi:hypothetical protein
MNEYHWRRAPVLSYGESSVNGTPRWPQMFDHEITSLQFNRPCPVCDGAMALSSIDSELWSLRTIGERLRFSCTSCGMTQSEWNAISVEAPSTAPE